MLKIENKTSCTVSMALSVLFFLALIGGAFALVPYLDAVDALGTIETGDRPVILGIGYAVLALAALTCLSLAGDGLVHSWLALLSPLFCEWAWQCLRLGLFTG